MTTEVQKPYEWRRVIVWAITLFLLGLTTARSPFSSGADRFALGLLSGIAWGVVGGAIVAVWKYFKRSISTISPAELQANDKGIFIAAIVLAVFLAGKSLYFEMYGALVDAAILVGLGLGVKAGFGPARWGFAIYAIVSPILVMANGGGNAVIWPFVFYYACRSLSCDVVPATGSENISPTSFAAAPSFNPVQPPAPSESISPREESNQQTMLNHPSPVTPMQTTSISTVPQAFSFDEDAVYEVVANEMDSGKMDKGLWTRLYAEHDGDEKKTKIAYIKQRADKLMAAETLRVTQEAQQQIEQNKIMSELVQKIRAGAIDRLEAEKSVGGMGPAYLAACRRGKVADVKRMITDRPMLLAVRDKEGNTGLHLAVSAGHKDIVICLVEHGIYKQARTDAGTTASDMARQYGLKEIAAVLE